MLKRNIFPIKKLSIYSFCLYVRKYVISFFKCQKPLLFGQFIQQILIHIFKEKAKEALEGKPAKKRTIHMRLDKSYKIMLNNICINISSLINRKKINYYYML